MNVHVDRATLVLGECDVLSLTDAIGAVGAASSDDATRVPHGSVQGDARIWSQDVNPEK